MEKPTDELGKLRFEFEALRTATASLFEVILQMGSTQPNVQAARDEILKARFALEVAGVEIHNDLL